jgi:hypothetical protein
MAGFEISTESLRSSAEGLVQVVDRMTTALNELETKLRGYGSPWGTGVLGPVIGDLYQDIHDMAMSSFEANAEVISEYAEGLDGMAEEMDEIEAELKEGFEFFKDQVGESFR